MSDFFKSAMGYFNNPVPSSNGINSNIGAQTGSSLDLQNKYCGKILEITGHKLLVKRCIAEGGYAFVYVVLDMQTQKEYALKRLIGADKQACESIINEINTHKQLSGHPNIVSFTAATYNLQTSGAQPNAEYLLVTELCKGGSLIDCLTSALDPPLVLRIFYQACRAVSHMHAQSPPVIHRDIKIENFLLGNDKQLKLCDFGSATRDVHKPTVDWNAQKRNLLEDQMSTVTTPMYRPPEVLDTWSNYEIGTKMDIWALGCILYVLCFQKHPFEDSAKLRIINGNFIIPTNSKYNCFHEIVKGCLAVNPAKRFNISMILERLAAISEANNWSLKGPLDLLGKPITSTPEDSPTNGMTRVSSSSSIPSTVPPSGPMPNPRLPSGTSHFYTDDPSSLPAKPLNNQSQPSSNPLASSSTNTSLLSSLRGGAGNFLKNLKDTSTKVMQTMQQTIARTDLDISCITSRVLVMPCPSEGFESTYKTNNIEDVRLSIESRFSLQKVSVYNFGPKNCPRLPPPVRTVEVGSIYVCPQASAPSLPGLYSVTEDMYNFLKADSKSVVVIQTGDSGGCAAATIVCGLLMYSGLIQEPEDAVQVFAVKRHPINLRPSEFRYLYYFGDILRPIPLLPHYKTINLVSLNCHPVPKMTKARDGCRIYMEIWCNDALLLSTLDDYEKMRLYLAGPGKITLPINLTVFGDVTVILYHARTALKGMVRPQSLKICQFQMQTGFIPEQETLLTLARQDLDCLPDLDQVPANFKLSISLCVTDSECRPSRSPPWIPAQAKRNPSNLFGSPLEYEEMVDNFVTKPISSPSSERSSMKAANIPTEANLSRPGSPLIMPDITEIVRDIPNNHHEPSPPIDLLNLNQPTHLHSQADSQNSVKPTSDASFDLLGAFGDDDSSGIASVPIPDILADNAQPKSTDLDDIFGLGVSAPGVDLDFGAFTSNTCTNSQNGSSPLLGSPFSATIPTVTTSMPSKETSPQASIDPFAELATLTSDLNLNKNSNTNNGKTPGTSPMGGNSPYTTQFSTPIHNNGTPMTNTSGSTFSPNHMKSPMANSTSGNSGFGASSFPNSSSNNNSANNSNRQSPQLTPSNPTKSNLGTQPQQQSQPQTQSQQKPDYSRTHFDQTKSDAGAQTKSKNADIFGDILGAQGYTFGSKSNQGPRSINEMRKEDLIKEMDPNKVKIIDWTDGKKNNIRALLCSMHTVLWDGAKWNKCEMSTLISPAEVKKAYRKACLAVHPDKHNGTDNEEIAKLIFMELNNAWTDFENDATQQNMFSL